MMKNTLMKLLCALLCLALLTSATALADTVRLSDAQPEAEIAVEILGQQYVGEYDCPNILQITVTDARTGELISRVYALGAETGPWEDEGLVAVEDVNFDGYADLVIATAIGASNATYTFYLWDEALKGFFWYGGPDLWNYVLYPEQNLVMSHGTSGWAGLLHQTDVYAWIGEGGEQQLVRTRSSVWDTVHASSYEDWENGFIVVEEYDEKHLQETYTDYLTGETVTEVFDVARYENDGDFLTERLAAEEEFLGLDAVETEYNDGSNG